MELFAQALGVVAAALVIFSFQQKKQRMVVIWQMIGQLLFFFSYLLLGITVGACLNLLGFFRGIVYSNRERFRADRILWLVIFAGAYLAVYTMSFVLFGNEPTLRNLVLEILPVLALTASTASFRSTDSAVVRRLGLISAPLWLTYNAVNLAVGGVICEIFNLISIVVGMIRLDIKRRK